MFFCKEYAVLEQKDKLSKNLTPDQLKIKALFKLTCSRLDEAHREDALLKALDVPNDNVRLAVVHCLYYVPIDELQAPEIDNLVKLLQPQNVGAGKTELVLSVIFNILSNLISDPSKKALATTTLFKTKFSYTAITNAIAIMLKNQERRVDDEEEEEEKYTLALSVVNFLKHVSKESKTRDQLKNKSEVLKKLLFDEFDKTTQTKFRLTPVEIESTQMGLDFEALLYAIRTSHEQIEPYNLVSFRILHQMANLLE